MATKDRVYDLEERLVKFSGYIIDTVESLPSTRSGNYIAAQLIRCGLSPALNYGEAQAAESRSDFIHKMKVSLKELKETRVCIKIILDKMKDIDCSALLLENEELIAMTAKGIVTAKKNSDLAMSLEKLPPGN